MDIFCYGFAYKCIIKDLLVAYMHYKYCITSIHFLNVFPKIADTENKHQDDIIMITDVMMRTWVAQFS